MKIGISVITAGNRKLKDYLLHSENHEVVFHVQVDSEKLGPGHMRNKALRKLYDEGCDIMVVFDDDCYPIKEGWIDYLAFCYEKTGISFFGLPEAFKDIPQSMDREIVFWNACLTQFAMYDRKLLETVGGYNTAYDRYGFEDSAYIFRVLRSGLIGDKGYPCPIRVLSYIHSDDVYARTQVQNISYEDKQRYIAKNRIIFDQEVSSNQLFYDF